MLSSFWYFGQSKLNHASYGPYDSFQEMYVRAQTENKCLVGFRDHNARANSFAT